MSCLRFFVELLACVVVCSVVAYSVISKTSAVQEEIGRSPLHHGHYKPKHHGHLGIQGSHTEGVSMTSKTALPPRRSPPLDLNFPREEKIVMARQRKRRSESNETSKSGIGSRIAQNLNARKESMLVGGGDGRHGRNGKIQDDASYDVDSVVRQGDYYYTYNEHYEQTRGGVSAIGLFLGEVLGDLFLSSSSNGNTHQKMLRGNA